ncbi:MAG: hypothetical protein LUE64_01555, partial [Candidatus Gastranaerophilales bacterium]|nr:hypothetical protein [Candidatus Gastranaerophilales bacterium]
LYTKFNRGLVLALVDKNVYEAVQTYRSYIAYLKENNLENELITTRNAFLNKLVDFAKNPENVEKISELIPAYQELMVAFPDNDDIRLDCAMCFNRLKQYDIALEILKGANQLNIKIQKSIAQNACCNKNLDLAIKAAKFVCEKEPHVSDNFCVLGTCYDVLYGEKSNEEDLNKAIENMELARKMTPSGAMYIKNLIILYTKAKNEKALEKAWAEYFKFGEFTANDNFNYAAYLIRHGDFINGFKYYEKRFELEKELCQKLNIPKWDGSEDLSGKHILVEHEQGFGDSIMFARFLNQLKAKKITLYCPSPLAKLFARSFPDINVTSLIVSSDYDRYIPAASLPYILKLTPENIPFKEKYLFADEEKIAAFKEKFFKGDEFKIGISYRGNPSMGNKTRDLKPKDFSSLAEIKGVKLYSIQFGEPDSVFENTKIINMAPFISDFDDSAAVIENMDLIISTDNVNLNMAGALGKKTFGLFNSLQEFRWFDLSSDDVKWYSSVKPYQCKHQNDWKPVIEKVKADVKGLLG